MLSLETWLWYLEITWDYIRQMLPCMITALIGFLLLRPPRRRKLLQRNGLFSPPCREGALLFLSMYCAGLVALTMFPAGFWSMDHWHAVLQGEKELFPPIDWHSGLENVQLTPFQEIKRGMRGQWVFFMVLANVGIFLPFGLLTALLWRKPRWWKTLLAGLGTSCVIEFVQLFIGRSSDVDDVILNSSGALIGYWLFCLLRSLFPKLLQKFQCEEKRGRSNHGRHDRT